MDIQIDNSHGGDNSDAEYECYRIDNQHQD